MRGPNDSDSRLLLQRSVFFQFAVKGGLADAKQARGFQLVAVQLLDGAQNGVLFHLRNRQDAVCRLGMLGGSGRFCLQRQF